MQQSISKLDRHKISKSEQLLELLAVLGLIMSFVILVTYWKHPAMPQVMTLSHGMQRPDRWGGQGIALWILASGVISYLLLTYMNRFPQAINFPVSPEIQAALKPQFNQLAQLIFRITKCFMSWMCAWAVWNAEQVRLGLANGFGEGSLVLILIFLFGIVLFGGWRTARIVKPS